MSKTFPGQPVMVPWGTTTIGTLVWNFEFGLLGFICVLVFGAWDFHDCH